MRSRVVALLAAVLFAPPAWALDLDGAFTQGGLVIGRAAPGATVALDGRPLRVSPEGLFLLGFGREAAATATLRVAEPGRPPETRTLRVAPVAWDIQRIDGLPPRLVTPDPAVAARIREENRLIDEARRRDTAATGFAAGFQWPAAGRISGVFGGQRILNGEPRQPHKGVDIAAPEGAPVIACADGAVSLVHPDMALSGKTVVIDHGHGLSSIYIHMSAILVAEGAAVRKGDPIGRVGRTGRATGSHLHWGVSLFDVALDPVRVAGPMPGR